MRRTEVTLLKVRAPHTAVECDPAGLSNTLVVAPPKDKTCSGDFTWINKFNINS